MDWRGRQFYDDPKRQLKITYRFPDFFELISLLKYHFIEPRVYKVWIQIQCPLPSLIVPLCTYYVRKYIFLL